MFKLELVEVMLASKDLLQGPIASEALDEGYMGMCGAGQPLQALLGHTTPQRPSLPVYSFQFQRPRLQVGLSTVTNSYTTSRCSIKASVFIIMTPSDCVHGDSAAASMCGSNSFSQSKLFLKDGSLGILFKAIKLKVAILY